MLECVGRVVVYEDFICLAIKEEYNSMFLNKIQRKRHRHKRNVLAKKYSSIKRDMKVEAYVRYLIAIVFDDVLQKNETY